MSMNEVLTIALQAVRMRMSADGPAFWAYGYAIPIFPQSIYAQGMIALPYTISSTERTTGIAEYSYAPVAQVDRAVDS